jgi:YbbR domain-containing protein
MTVKVITSGQIASGYRLTNISANPLVITLFSTDPDLIATLPGFIETQPLNLAGADDDLDVFLPLNVPSGAIVVGESTIKVSVAISPIEGSVTLNSLPIELVGITPQFQAILSPDRVDVILSGPIPELDKLRSSEVRVLLDLTDKEPGTYQIEPQIQVGVSGILVESILPATIEVELYLTPTPAPAN